MEENVLGFAIMFALFVTVLIVVIVLNWGKIVGFTPKKHEISNIDFNKKKLSIDRCKKIEVHIASPKAIDFILLVNGKRLVPAAAKKDYGETTVYTFTPPATVKHIEVTVNQEDLYEFGEADMRTLRNSWIALYHDSILKANCLKMNLMFNVIPTFNGA